MVLSIKMMDDDQAAILNTKSKLYKLCNKKGTQLIQFYKSTIIQQYKITQKVLKYESKNKVN
jgi:hypothetical protein